MINLYNKEDLKYSNVFFNKRPPSYEYIFILILTSMIILLIIFAKNISKDQVIIAQGNYTNANVRYVTSEVNGKISKVNRKENDRIDKNDILILLDTKSSETKLTELNKKYSKINKQIDDLDLYKKALKNKLNYLSTNSKYYQKMEYYLQTLNNIEKQNAKQEKYKEKRIIKINKLDKSDSSTKEQLLEEIDSIENNIDMNNQQSKQMYYQLVIDADGERAQLVEKSNEIKSNIVEIKQQVELYGIKSSYPGKIHYMTDIKEGLAISAGQVIAKINSEDQKQILEVFIRPEDITKIKKGDECKIEFAGTNIQKEGYKIGHISAIDTDIIRKEENGIISSFYRAEVFVDELDENKIEINSLPANVKIIYDKETYYDWFKSLINFDK